MQKKITSLLLASVLVGNGILGTIPIVHAEAIQEVRAEDSSQIQAGYGFENWGTRQYVPYFDVGAYPSNPLLLWDYMQATGTQNAFLSFVVTNPDTNELVWGGANAPVDSLQPNGRDMLFDDVRRLREDGRDLGVAFGGAGVTALPETVLSIDEAVAQYKAFITDWGFTHIDFDIEGNLTYDLEGHANRAEVIQRLKSELAAVGHPLNVSYTIALGMNGIEPKEVAIIEPAIAAGIEISRINFMAFDYGDIGNSSLVEVTESALRASHTTLKNLFQTHGQDKTDAEIWQLIGITSMADQDDQMHSFTLEDAQEIIDFADSVGIEFLSLWSINRDSNDNSWLPGFPGEGAFSEVFVNFITNDGSEEPFRPIPAFTYPPFDSATAYVGGERVEYQGRIYLATSWSQGGSPTTNTWAWRLLAE